MQQGNLKKTESTNYSEVIKESPANVAYENVRAPVLQKHTKMPNTDYENMQMKPKPAVHCSKPGRYTI
jgi:hypothetical protein